MISHRLYRTFSNFTSQAGRSVLTATPSKQIELHNFSLTQRSSSISSLDLCALCIGLPTRAFEVWNSFASDTEVTSSIQAGTTTTLLNTTNNHSMVIACVKQFNLLSLDVVQGQSGSPVYVLEYWNGSSWTTLNRLKPTTIAFTGSAESTVIWSSPLDWAVGPSSGFDSGVASMYCIRIRPSTASSQAVTANGIRIASVLAARDLNQYQQLQVSFLEAPLLMEQGEYLLPYFTTADTVNIVETAYKISP